MDGEANLCGGSSFGYDTRQLQQVFGDFWRCGMSSRTIICNFFKIGKGFELIEP
jgi:hypothetical protein